MTEYARPETLVSTDWVAEHREDDGVRLVEVDVDTSAYDEGHIPGAVGFNWQSQLQDPTVRDIPDQEDFEELCSRAGISDDTTVVFYGDNNNWFAAYAFWLFRYYGHDVDKLKLMNGGRKKWLAEGRETTTEVPSYESAEYTAQVDDSVRTLRQDVLDIVEAGTAGRDIHLVDVRSPQEFTGEILAPPGMNETCQRGGHIPGAANIPWASAVNDDARAPTSSSRSMANKASPANSRSSPTVASASARRTPGTFFATCWATTGSPTTTAPGRNTATW